MDLLDLLVSKGILDTSEVPTIQEEVRSSGQVLEVVLKNHGITQADILSARGESFHVPPRALGETVVPFEVLQYVPEESASHYRFAPLGISDGVLEIGIVDPDNIDALDALNFISSRLGLPYKVFLISEKDFEKILGMYKGLSGEVNKALTDLEGDTGGESSVPFEEEIGKPGSEGEGKDVGEVAFKEDAPVTKMVATILQYAVGGRASDVHIEHTGDKVRVRFRIDGVLHTSLLLPAKVHRAVVARIKILALLRLDEKRKPQDGRFSATVEGRKVDFRVSTFPAYYGEKVVMRILDRQQGALPLEELGLTKEHAKAIRDTIALPYGLILLTGPTGCGKTTTLYSMLKELDREKHNVLSLEDPVEYNIDGMNQSQVRPEIGYSFASGLRSILRQDPDIIMVGEIRDKETAQLAVQAALTGHLVFSTLHTNNAIGAIPRLLDMGVDPYLIAPTLVMVIAQRLVRRLCKDTGRGIPVEGSMKVMLEKEFADLPAEFRKHIPWGKNIYGIESTSECPNGTRGRVGVFEVLTMNKSLEAAILKNVPETELNVIARRQGMFTMKEDAIIKSFTRVIPFEEVNTLGGEQIS